MPDFADDPVTRLAFNIQQNPGIYALLLGSGISYTSGILTGWGITLDLVRKVAQADGVEDQADWYAWYKATYDREPDYSHLLERLAPNPADRQPIIQAYLEPSRDPEDRKGRPTPAHQTIARLVRSGHIKVIVTTNFDRLLEMALTAEGIQPTIIASEDGCQGAVPLPHSPCTILKLHGDVLDVRSLNTAAELERYPERIDRLLDRILDEYGLIVCGWSADWDPALRSAFQRAPSRRYSTWWTSVGERKPNAQALIDHRRAVPIPIVGADGFFQELEVKVSTLARLNQPPPATTALVVAMAKRYLARPDEFRIELADLVTSEADRLIAALTGPDFDPAAPYSLEALVARRNRYESITERLAILLGVLGRWGVDDPAQAHERLAHNTMARLYLAAKATDHGHRHYINIRTYPILLLFHAYGVGLIHGQRWQALLRFFRLQVGRRIADQQPLVQLMLLTWWEPLHARDDFVTHLTGRVADGHEAPVTDHVWQRAQPWLSHFAQDAADRDMLHARFLVYGSFAHFCQRHERYDSQGQPALSGVDMAVPVLERTVLRFLVDELITGTHEGKGFAPAGTDQQLYNAYRANLNRKVRLDG